MTRQRLPAVHESITRRFQLTWPEHICSSCGADPHEDRELRFYVTVGLYDDGNPGEIFISGNTMGEFSHGILNGLATTTSLALQHGCPIELIAKRWRGTQFIPEGFTSDPDYPRCSSLLDLVARWLLDRFGSAA